MLDNTPVYLISGHSCIGAEIGDTGRVKYDELDVPFAFTIPRNTFLLTFSEPGSSTCLSKAGEVFIHTQVELIRQLFYLHGPDEFVDHTVESIFSRTMRATGGPPGQRIDFPNPIYSFTPDREGAARGSNDFGVFDISDYKAFKTTTNLDSLIAQFDPDLPTDTVNKKDWTLEDIIKRVYEVTGNSRAIFLNLGCLIACTDDPKSTDKAARLMRHADIMYRNIIPVMSRRDMQRIGAETLINHTHKPRMLLGAIGMLELRSMLESGLYDPAALKEYKFEFHPDDRDEAFAIIQEFIDKAEAKA
jgi:hypothetical protein